LYNYLLLKNVTDVGWTGGESRTHLPPQEANQNLYYTRLISFRVSGAYPHLFAPGATLQGCNGGESLATCGKFDRIGIWIPYFSHHRQTSYYLCHQAGWRWLQLL